MNRDFGPCLCGDPLCPSCGRAMGTYPEPPDPDPDEGYDRAAQAELDDRQEAQNSPEPVGEPAPKADRPA